MPSDPSNDGLRVIGAGFGRTGTASMKVALETLGVGPCYHMWEVIGHPDRVAQWRGIVAGEPADWPAVFAGYHACVDWPACTYYAQLMDVYPAAKVLLTVRDAENWYESVRETIYRTRDVARQIEAGTLVLPPDMPAPTHALLVTELIWKQTFGDRFEDRDHAIAVYRAHNAEVRRRVPADKLLVYETGSGWEALCTFLGVPVPAEPFPRLNDRESWRGRTGGIAAREPDQGADGADGA